MALVGFAAGFILSALTGAVAVAATGYRSSDRTIPLAVQVASLLGLWTGLVGAAVYASRSTGSGRLDRDLGLRIGAWWDVPLGAAIGLVAQFGLIPLLYWPFERMDRSLAHQLSAPAERMAGGNQSVGTVAVLALFIAVGAPVVEELFFRGLLLRSIQGPAGAPVAVLVSALLFALAHFEGVQFAGLAVFGGVVGFLAVRTGRLGPSIGAHMAFNTAALLSVVHVR